MREENALYFLQSVDINTWKVHDSKNIYIYTAKIERF